MVALGVDALALLACQGVARGGWQPGQGAAVVGGVQAQGQALGVAVASQRIGQGAFDGGGCGVGAVGLEVAQVGVVLFFATSTHTPQPKKSSR